MDEPALDLGLEALWRYDLDFLRQRPPMRAASVMSPMPWPRWGILIAAMGLAAWARRPGNVAFILPPGTMALSAFLLDFAVTGDQTLGRRAVNRLNPKFRSRLNGLFVGVFFFGGAIGSAHFGR
jgi:hypothetical protein